MILANKIITSVFAFAMAAATLTGCNGTPDAATFVEQVRKTTTTACGFLPTVETVMAIFNANPALPVVQVANAVCSAVLGVSTMPGSGHKLGVETKPVVKVGDKAIKIDGEFVK